jgi:WD40 repeat protein
VNWRRPAYPAGLLVLAILTAQGLLATEAPSRPVLRIETAMHTATISRIAVDGGGRFVVTGSWDKTVRVWDAHTGRLLRTIDLPSGDGNEGQVYALAITPSGKTIAVGGWTGWDWDGSASVYFFERENGHLIRRIQGLPGRAIRLAYSPDGRFLALCLRGPNGLRLFDESGRLAGEDRDYGDDCSAEAFGADGKLVTSSRDGSLRLYALPGAGKPLRLIAKRRSEGGNRPFGISFSPDGLRIAVGFDDSPSVIVLSGADLTLTARADTASITNGNLASVAWSADGTQLCAGGMSADREAMRVVRVWSDRGLGSWRDVPAARDTVMDIVALPSGGFAYAAGDPAWGLISSDGKRQFVVASRVADYRGQHDRLLVSPDGMTVQFAFRLGAPPWRYSIANRDLSLAAMKDPELRQPRIRAEGLVVEHWENSADPVLNGRPLPLEPGEVARSVAASTDGASLIVGTEWNLDLFDRGGVRRWSAPAPDVVWAVNVSDDSVLAVAAFADGTIRWYRMQDGQELLTLFPSPDGKWIVWSASGYYDCSPGAEGLIGWHVNRGKDNAADFFAVSHFREDFYRPDVIANLLTSHDEERALRLASEDSRQVDVAKLLPPVVEITSPGDDSYFRSREASVFFSIRAPSGEPVTTVLALVNGRPVSTSAVSTPAGDELTIPLPSGDAEVSLIVKDRHTASAPATVHLQWRGPKAAETIKPVLYVLAIGVSEYRDRQLKPLDFPSKDAADIAAALGARMGSPSLYRKVETKVLRNEDATREAVLQAFQWVAQQPVMAGDAVVVFIAGHGVNAERDYYFLPYDADGAHLASTAIASSDVEKAIGGLGARAVLLIDTCHAGLATRRLAGDLNRSINDLSSPEHGIVVFAASTAAQSSLEDQAWGNGAFTKAVLEGLSGRAGSGSEIMVTALISYVSDRVKRLTAGRQSPVFNIPNTIPDFPIALRTN